MSDDSGFEYHTKQTLRTRLGYPSEGALRGKITRAKKADVERVYRERDNGVPGKGSGVAWYRVSVDWIARHQTLDAPDDVERDPSGRFDLLTEKDHRIVELHRALDHERQTTAWLRERIDQLEAELVRLRGSDA
jgi:hypothetical protein